MKNQNELCSKYLDKIRQSIHDQIFVKITLGNYQGQDEQLKQLIIKPVVIKNINNLSFTYRYKTRDIVKNYPHDEGIYLIEKALHDGFNVSTLFTIVGDVVYDQHNASKIALRELKATITQLPDLAHDRNKKRAIQPTDKPYLTDLKITDQTGKVLMAAQDKYRQINRYIELLEPLLRNLPVAKTLNVCDMGSGKGYLTFALYDYLINQLKLKTQMTGVEFRADLVETCNRIAQNHKFESLKFEKGTIESYANNQIDLLIALHACDTATDEALYKGIIAGAKTIVVAPCCHKQIRREIEKNTANPSLHFITRHGIFMERQAEMVTDAIRALILENYGYKIKIFEFISTAHTPKNIMITAEFTGIKPTRQTEIMQQIKEAKTFFGISYHHLERLLKM